MKNVLIIGSGGREHALADKLKQDRKVGTVFCAPGNGGTKRASGIENIDFSGFDDLKRKVQRNAIDLVVVGPEKPLAEGIADFFEGAGISCFGFKKSTARLESSKNFADEFKRKYGVQSPSFESFSVYEEARNFLKERFSRRRGTKLWVKADELCGGKGVIGVETLEEGEEALSTLLKEKKCGVGEKVIIQEDVPGEEITVQALTDGDSFVLTPSSQDHKQLYEGGVGPNTGGMGAYAPAPAFSGQVEKNFRNEVLLPTSKGLREEGLGGPGVLYFGLGLSETGNPKVLEYNVRFGDPEAQTVLRLLDSDLYPILKAASENRLSEIKGEVDWQERAAICVILSVDGYPRDYGDEVYPIEGLKMAGKLPEVRIYHSGTAVEDGTVYTNGGRILSVTAVGDSVREARRKVYRAIDEIHFEGMYYRKDIGSKAV